MKNKIKINKKSILFSIILIICSAISAIVLFAIQYKVQAHGTNEYIKVNFLDLDNRFGYLSGAYILSIIGLIISCASFPFALVLLFVKKNFDFKIIFSISAFLSFLGTVLAIAGYISGYNLLNLNLESPVYLNHGYEIGAIILFAFSVLILVFSEIILLVPKINSKMFVEETE